MADKRREINAKTLIIALSSLLVVAVVLVVAIIILSVKNNLVNQLSDDNLAKECLQKEDSTMIEYCLTDTAFSYFDEGDCEKALKVYDDIPASMFDEDSLQYLYDDAYSLSLSCEDESLQEYWSKKSDSFANQLEAKD